MSHVKDIKGGYAPYGKTGQGSYGASLGKQNSNYLDYIQDKVLEMAKSIPFPDNMSVFNIGDYGTADGAASMTFIRDMILALREHHGPEMQVQVIYEDKAINDFNSLFKRLSGIIPDPPSYLLELDNVYALASGIDFRKQCVPSDSMHFILATAAIHWLSKTPVQYRDSLYTYPDSSEEEKEALRKQARIDWECFLLKRSTELKHGGILLVASIGYVGEYMEENDEIMLSGLYLMTQVWRSFRDSGKITTQEFINTNLDVCLYSLDQLKAPFEDPASRVYLSGLRLLATDTIFTDGIYFQAWKLKKEREGVDDRQEFARNYVAATRSWSNNTFFTGLSCSRTEQEKKDIVDELYRTIEQKLAEMDLEGFSRNVTNYVIIGKD